MTDDRNSKHPFNALGLPCICEGMTEDLCACMDEERALRNILKLDGRMTPVQRAWCADQIAWVGDNTDQPTDAEIAAMTDAELARTTLSAWSDYVRSVS